MRYVRIFALAVLVVMVGACATVPSRSNADNGAIYGYFGIPKDSGVFDNLSMLQYPQKVKAYMGYPTDVRYIIVGGAYFAFDAEPGQYYIMMISAGPGGGIRFGGQTRNDFKLIDFKLGDNEGNKARVEKNLITLKPGEMVFAGTQQITLEEKPGLFTGGSFSIQSAKGPSEKEVLQMLLPALKDTPWEKPVADRIAGLK